MMETEFKLPFSSLSDFELQNLFDNCIEDSGKTDFADYVASLKGCIQLQDCRYYTETDFNNQFHNFAKFVNFSVLHLNIRCLNSKIRGFCQLIYSLDYTFDVIVLSELWAYNVKYYCNILPEYQFHYKLPEDSKVGGVGIFVRNCYTVQEITHLDIDSSQDCKLENLWLRISSESKKLIVGGIYRHPNQNITEFKCKIEQVLQSLSNHSSPCIIAGDINIDLIKFESHSGTAAYIDNLLCNNFIPAITIPTRITSSTSTLIDHIYAYPGKKRNNYNEFELKSGNLLSDISDHLPNFIFILNNEKMKEKDRPMVRIFSQTNYDEFKKLLESADWSSVYEEQEVNIAYEKFHSIVTKAFNASFPFKKVSKKRMKDKPWITSALRISSQVKNKLFKKWLKTKSQSDEFKYKEYRKEYKKISLEAESSYYRELFDNKTNSIKQLWRNLNTVSSFRNSKYKKVASHNCSLKIK